MFAISSSLNPTKIKKRSVRTLLKERADNGNYILVSEVAASAESQTSKGGGSKTDCFVPLTAQSCSGRIATSCFSSRSGQYQGSGRIVCVSCKKDMSPCIPRPQATSLNQVPMREDGKGQMDCIQGKVESEDAVWKLLGKTNREALYPPGPTACSSTSP